MNNIFETFIPAAKKGIHIIGTNRMVPHILGFTPYEVLGVVDLPAVRAKMRATGLYGANNKLDLLSAWHDLKDFLPAGNMVFASRHPPTNDAYTVDCAIIKADMPDRFTMAYRFPQSNTQWLSGGVQFQLFGDKVGLHQFVDKSEYTSGLTRDECVEYSVKVFKDGFSVLLYTLYLMKHQAIMDDKPNYSASVLRYREKQMGKPNYITRPILIDLTKAKLESLPVLSDNHQIGTGSPKSPHNRRGHIRKMKATGKIVHVRPTKVKGGSAASVPRVTVFKILPDQRNVRKNIW